jgi:hypothetical protein
MSNTGSIINKPHDEKFRMIKKNNAAIQKKLLGLNGGVHELLLALGYIDVRLPCLIKYRWMTNTTFSWESTL